MICVCVEIVLFSGYNCRLGYFIKYIQHFLMFHCSYYSVTLNETKEKFKINFLCFSAITNIVVPLSFSNFCAKLIYWEIIAFACLDKSIATNI